MKTLTTRFFALFLVGLLTSNFLHAQAVLNIEVKDVNGNTSTIADVAKGKFIVLDFWATWCKPCVKSLPKLVKLSKKYDVEELSFIGINEDSPRNTNKVKPFVKSLGISYPVLLDPNQDIMTELMVSSFPTLLVINRKGKVLYTHQGYSAGDELLIEEEINKILGKHE